MSEAGLDVRGLCKRFPLRSAGGLGRRGTVTAVDDVSFAIPAGSTFGLVGESGSGKSTVARMILKLETPSGGGIHWRGQDIFRQDRAGQKAWRRTAQAVLQDPYGALSPRLRVGEIIAEPLQAQGADRAAVRARIPELLTLVGLAPDAADRYPHQFSGGQRQRIAIARAVSVDPALLVLDEPVSALDVSVRAQILILLREMQARLGLTYLFIGHDLAVVNYISSVVGVMYFGRLVETGPADDVLQQPLHPYTRRLVAIAAMSEKLGHHRAGEPPDPRSPPSGCAFRTRCGDATERCAAEAPVLRAVGSRQVACHHAEAVAAAPARPLPVLQPERG